MPTRSRLHNLLLGGVLCSALIACEAPLQLEGVAASEAQAVLRTDAFQDVIVADDAAIFVGGGGVVVEMPLDKSESSRTIVGEGAVGPDLIDIERCDDGRVFALDLEKNVWQRLGAGEWAQHPIETYEDVQSVACAPDGTLWVSAGFATLVSSADGGATWSEQSFDDDLMFTSIVFPGNQTGYAIGEFNGLAKTVDGGATWENLSTVPDIYPLAVHFETSELGWIAGLGGEIHATTDGGLTWAQEPTASDAPLYRIARIGGDTFAVGNFGVSLVRENGRWVNADLGVQSFGYLRALAGTEDEIFVGGQSLAVRVSKNLNAEPAVGGNL